MDIAVTSARRIAKYSVVVFSGLEHLFDHLELPFDVAQVTKTLVREPIDSVAVARESSNWKTGGPFFCIVPVGLFLAVSTTGQRVERVVVILGGLHDCKSSSGVTSDRGLLDGENQTSHTVNWCNSSSG